MTASEVMALLQMMMMMMHAGKNNCKGFYVYSQAIL